MARRNKLPAIAAMVAGIMSLGSPKARRRQSTKNAIRERVAAMQPTERYQPPSLDRMSRVKRRPSHNGPRICATAYNKIVEAGREAQAAKRAA